MKKTSMRLFQLILVIVTGSLLLGCATKKRTFYLNQDANFGAVQRVALLPFDNFTGDPHAPDKAAQILTIELLSAEVFELVDSAEVRQALAEVEYTTAGRLTSYQSRTLGEKLNVQALFIGTVQELTQDRTAGVVAPTVSLHLELIDPGTGTKIWSSVVSRQGAGVASRLFGVGGSGVNEALRELMRSALKTLIK